MNRDQSLNVNFNRYLSVDDACLRVLPLLASQIEMARSQTEQAITDLVGRFTKMTSRVISLSEQLNNDSAVFKTKEQHHQTTGAEQELVALAGKIMRYCDDLKNNSEHGMVNAIESYNSLSTRTENEKTKQYISEQILRTIEAMQTSQDIKLNIAKLSDKLVQLTNKKSSSADDKHSALFKELKDDLNIILISFQFQDRVCQIMEGVIKSLKAIMDSIVEQQIDRGDSGSSLKLDVAKLNGIIQSFYRTQEQHALSDTAENRQQNNDNVVFF